MAPLDALALSLVSPNKGILAADESHPTIGKRFDAVGIPSTPDSRRAYREMLFTTPGLSDAISGVILFDETLRQNAADGRTFVKVLTSQGIVPGIKVDRGARPLAGFRDETITEGLDGLRDRLAEYRELGARFTKWRAVLRLSDHTPTQTAIESNAEALARFAALSQEAQLLPIVEPEVLMDGSHSIERHYDVTRQTLHSVFAALGRHRIQLSAMLLKPNMVLSGKECPEQAEPPEVAERTLRCLRETVPAAVPGIMFLSGGQTDEQATKNLNAINKANLGPWALSFSFGRALQSSALKAWKGRPENTSVAQDALHKRARANASARLGMYAGGRD